MQTVTIHKESGLNKLSEQFIKQTMKYFPSKTHIVRMNESKKRKFFSYKKIQDQKLHHIESQKATEITFIANQHKEDHTQNKKSYVSCKQKVGSFQPLKKIADNLTEFRKSGLRTINPIDIKSEKKILGSDEIKSPIFRRTVYRKQDEYQRQSTFCRTFCLSETKKHKIISLEMKNSNIKPPMLQNYRPSTRFRKVSNIGEESNNNFLAKYEIIKQLGKGTYGTVFLAKIMKNDHSKLPNKTSYFNSLRQDTYENELQEKSQKTLSKVINGFLSSTEQSLDHQQIDPELQSYGTPIYAENLESELILESQQRDQPYISLDKKSQKINNRSISLALSTQKVKQNLAKREQNSSLIFRGSKTKATQKQNQTNHSEAEEQTELVAIKVYEKFKMNKDPAKFKNIRKQITIMQNLSHQGVIKLYESVESITKISLVVQYGGDLSLLDYLKKNFPLSKEKLKDFAKQLLETIVYLHEKNIVHRDIKPQNILVKMDKKNENSERLKLIDYGFSTLTNKSRKINVICGTPNFMAPQLLTSKPYYGQKADVWSFGVVVFVMAEGRHPFKASQYQQLTRMVKKGKYVFKRSHEQSFEQFISYILKVNDQQRPAANQILKHKWLQQP